MNNFEIIKSKICTLNDLKEKVIQWKKDGEKVIFTNGCFDIIHRGHIEVLANTADLGDKLIIGLNTDSSIQKLKGLNRPIIDEESRALLLASLSFVDAIILFAQDNPLNLIKILNPDILAKGGDYSIDTIIGHEIIRKNGGKVVLIPFIDGFSSSKIISKIKES